MRELKIYSQYYEAIVTGLKTFEVREQDADQPFFVGEVIFLKEYDPFRYAYTGGQIAVRITYILTHDDFPQGIALGYCVFSFRYDRIVPVDRLQDYYPDPITNQVTFSAIRQGE